MCNNAILGLCLSSLLDEQEMHGCVGHDDGNTWDNAQTGYVIPQGEVVEAKRTQNRRTRNFDVEAIFMINQRQESDFVYNQSLECIMEDGQLYYETLEEWNSVRTKGLKTYGL